jgi:hypothetical protein
MATDPVLSDLPPVAVPAAPPTQHRGGRRLVRRLAAGGLAVVCLSALGGGWIAWRGVHAREQLQLAAGLVQQLRLQVASGDADAGAGTLAELQRRTRAAREDTGGPGWWLARGVPVVGDDLSAVRTVASALDELARDGLPPLVRTARSLDPGSLAPTDGRVNLIGLQAAAPELVAADAAVQRARDRVAAIAVDGLVPQLGTAVVDLQHGLDRAAAVTATVARTAALLPAMLGAGGPRTYLVLFQNLAETRATGGMPGAYVVVAADHGAIKIIDEGSAAGLKTFARPVLPLPATLRALYSDRPSTMPADVNFTPHFPTAAMLAREMYRLRSGRTVDGVIATDPVALSYLLRSTGPVSVPGGPTLTLENAVRVLLSETYSEDISPVEQNRYFAAAARSVFQAIMQRPIDPAGMLADLSKAAGERRLLVWSADAAEQRSLTDTMLGGQLPLSDGARPTVGVFLNDGSASKLGYYLTHTAELAVLDGCPAAGRRKLGLRVTLGSTAPRTGLSPYVLASETSGDPYTLRTMVSVYSSTGGTVVGVKLDGTAANFGSGTDRRRSVARIAVDLKPGATRTLDVALLTGVPRKGGGSAVFPQLRTTPGITAWSSSVRTADGCASRR